MKFFRILALSACMLIVSEACSAVPLSRPIMEVDFSKTAWTELMKADPKNNPKANATVTSGVITIPAGVGFASLPLARMGADTITVSIHARSVGIKQGKAGWHIGRAVIHGLGKKGNEILHRDLVGIKGDKGWQHYTASYRLSSAVKAIRVSISNQGISGTVQFRNLKVSIKPEAGDDLIGDSDFEGVLGTDNWYFKNAGKDWDNIPFWKKGSAVTLDKTVAVSGKQCLRMTGPSTVISKEFDYNGERIILGVWLRSEDFTNGPGWRGAGIQLVGLDANGRHISHRDSGNLLAFKGTVPWRHIPFGAQFNSAVKKVQVYIRIFDGASGTIWCDQLRLLQVPMDGDVAPFDASKASVTVNAAKPGNMINHKVWNGVDNAYACWLLRSDAPMWLDRLREAGIETVRMHEFNNAIQPIVKRDAKGKFVYDWTKFNKLMDMLVIEYGMHPIITLESTPKGLDRPGTRGANYANPSPPADMKAFGQYTEDLFEHAIARYGKAEVSTWLWEVWNEPFIGSSYFKGTREELGQIAVADYLAAERVEKRHGIDLKMGLTSGGGYGMDITMLEPLKKLGKLDQIDHISLHDYSGNLSTLRGAVKRYTKGLRSYKDRYPGMRKDYVIGCTEWNASSMVCTWHDRPWNATLVIRTVRDMLDNNLDYGLFFCGVDHPELRSTWNQVFNGGLGMQTKNGVPKPVFNAFVFLKQLKGGRRLKLASSNDPINGVAALMPGGTIRIVLVSYDEDYSRLGYTTRVKLSIEGVKGKYRCTQLWAADRKHGNSYGKWLQLGKPSRKNIAARAKMIAASRHVKLPAVGLSRNAKTATLTCMIDMPGPSIRFIELTPVNKP